MTNSEPNLFERHSPPEMVDKLKRELDRFTKARTRDECVDHLMNFVWTAWHLIERTWLSMQALTPEERARLDTALGANWQSEDEFRTWSKQQCPELGACRQLANSAKHVGNKYRLTDEQDTDLTASATVALSGVTWRDIERRENWAFKIEYGGGTHSAENVCHRVIEFWTRVMGYGLSINWP